MVVIIIRKYYYYYDNNSGRNLKLRFCILRTHHIAIRMVLSYHTFVSNVKWNNKRTILFSGVTWKFKMKIYLGNESGGGIR
jgi:hypothetical protein